MSIGENIEIKWSQEDLKSNESLLQIKLIDARADRLLLMRGVSESSKHKNLFDNLRKITKIIRWCLLSYR